MKNLNGKLSKKQVGAIIDFTLDVSDMSNHEIDEHLHANGIDVDYTVSKVLNLVDKHLYKKKSWQEIALEKKEVGQNIVTSSGCRLMDTSQNLLNSLKIFLASEGMQLEHRDYESMTEEDLLSLFEDAEFLRKFNESNRKS